MSESNVKIVAHSSQFHPDDVFAVAVLTILLKDKNVTIIRSRDGEVINAGDYVVDVGSIYDPLKRRFDHHQPGGAGKRSNGVPYASFGLVWKEFGEKLCGNHDIAEKIDKILVQPIDSLDNGMQFTETKIPGLHPFDVGSLVFLFCPTWKEDEVDFDARFIELSTYARKILERLIKVNQDEFEAREKVINDYNRAEDKRLIVLEGKYPWEEVLSKFPEPLFVVYKNRDNNWSLKTIRNDQFSFESRKNLPLSWAGKSFKELSEITGVPDAIFCHNARFLAVAETQDSILKMAEIALKD